MSAPTPAPMMHVVVIGAGIVGVSVARELAARGVRVTVVERDRGPQRGSTAFAPGFVGIYNDAPVLTELARASVDAYREMESFSRPGGLELATTREGADALARRVEAARQAGLAASLNDPRSLPSFVDERRVTAAARYDDDGVTTPHLLRGEIRAVAEAAGARFVDGAEVVSIHGEPGRWSVHTADRGVHTADQVVLAGGVWDPGLSRLIDVELPLFPVAHPYVYASAETPVVVPGPFVRWPEHHVYARAHGDTLGIGSYDHRPLPVGEDDLREGAGLSWNRAFQAPIDAAQQLLRRAARFTPSHRVNGVFAMTPDNLPFLGAVPDAAGLWIAQAVWVTHAGGSARALAAAMLDGTALPADLAVDRFDGESIDGLRASALRLYRDIYANDAA